MMDAGDAKDLTDGLGRLASSLDRIGSPSTANVRIDAGGAGVWAATSACMVMLGVLFVSLLWVGHEFDRISGRIDELTRRSETQEAYLQAIYQIAPTLKPKESP